MAEIKIEHEYGFGNGFQEVPPPLNLNGISIELSWVAQYANATVNGVDFIWVNENAKKMQAYKLSGLSGGLGITEGIGQRLYKRCSPDAQWEKFFDGYAKVARAKWECDEVAAQSVESSRVDWFVNKIKGFSFGYLKSIGVISPADYKRTPYCVVKISQAPLQEAMIALTELAVLKQGFETIKDISTLTSKTTGDAASSALTLGATTPTTVADVVQIGFDIVYLTACAVTLLVEGKKIIDSVWQFKKYKLCMREEDIWKKICQHLGLQFVSTIYSVGVRKNATWMPKKNAIRNLGNPLNFTRAYNEQPTNNINYYGHPDGLASEFVAEMCDRYFGEVAIRIDSATGLNTLYFERSNDFNNVAVFTVPNTGTGYTHNLPDPDLSNILDLPWNLEVINATDPTDETTTDSYRGTTCSKNVHQTNVGIISRCENGDGDIVQLTSSIGRRKNSLSKVEYILNAVINLIIQLIQDIINLVTAIYNAIAWVINLFGGNVQPLVPFVLPTNLLNNRLGWLEVTDDKFSIPKSFIGRQVGGDWVLDANSEANCSALSLMNNFWQYALPTHGAQGEIFQDKKFKFCCDDYNKVKNMNVITTPDGRYGKFTKLKWDLHTDEATADYIIFTTETNNLTETTTVDGV